MLSLPIRRIPYRPSYRKLANASFNRKLSAMATESKPLVLYTAATPNGIVPSILLQELKVRLEYLDA